MCPEDKEGPFWDTSRSSLNSWVAHPFTQHGFTPWNWRISHIKIHIQKKCSWLKMFKVQFFCWQTGPWRYFWRKTSRACNLLSSESSNSSSKYKPTLDQSIPPNPGHLEYGWYRGGQCNACPGSKKKHHLLQLHVKVEETAKFYYISPTTTWNKGKSHSFSECFLLKFMSFWGKSSTQGYPPSTGKKSLNEMKRPWIPRHLKKENGSKWSVATWGGTWVMGDDTAELGNLYKSYPSLKCLYC